MPQLVTPSERAVRFIFPNAPTRAVTINNGMRMRAWYDIKGLDRRATEDDAGFRDSDAQIRALIERERGRGIAPNRIVLAGFSQGGAVSLYMLSRFPERLAGVMALSSYLPRDAVFALERLAANDKTPIFMAHGRADPVLPLSMGVASRDFLLTHGYKVEWHEYPMPHSVCPAEVFDIRSWLLRVLP